MSFSNTLISDITLLLKYNSFNSLKLTFSNSLIYEILLLLKSNLFNSLNLIFAKSFNPSFSIYFPLKFNSLISISSILVLYLLLNSFKVIYISKSSLFTFNLAFIIFNNI